MASPLSAFRKHQKKLIVVFGILLMVSFLITGSVNQFLSGQSGGPGGTVVSWNHGKVDEMQMQEMRTSHGLAVRFLTLVIAETQSREGSPKVPVGRNFPGIPGTIGEEGVVENMLLAQKAEDMGMVVDKEAIDDFLQKLSDSTLTSQDFNRIMKEALGGRMTFNGLYEQLRKELLAQNLRQMMRNQFAISPAAAWNYYQRINRKLSGEILPLDVASYVSRVEKEPTEAEIKALYEERKDEYSYPDSHEPGFRMRELINFQYFVADFNKFLEEELPKVTEEEIKKEYDKRIAAGEFKVQKLPDVPGVTDESGDDSPDIDLDPGSTDQPATGDAPVPPSTEDAPVPPSGDPPPSPADSADSEEQPGEESPAGEVPPPGEEAAPQDNPPPADGEAETPDSEQPPAGDGAALLKREQFVSLQEEDAAGESAEPNEEPTGEPGEESAEPAADPQEEPAPPAEEPKQETTEEPPENETQPEESSEVSPDDLTAPPLEEEKEEDKDKPKEEEKPKFKPLAEVSEEIRTSLARPKAQDRMNAALNAAKQVIDEYARDRRLSKAKDQPEPKMPDLEAVAKQNGLKLGKTGLVDVVSIQDHPLGMMSTFSFANQQLQQIQFHQIAFGNGLPLYRTASFPDEFSSRDTRYVYWKTEEKEARTPELKEVRERVIDAIKFQEAYKLALQDAQEMAKKAAQAKSLSKAFPKQAHLVQPTGEFSWVERGLPGSGGLSLGRVNGVEFPGQEFMEDVFKLKPGETGAAPNAPHTKIYVVHIQRETTSPEVLRQQFLTTGLSNEVMQMAMGELGTIYRDWFASLEKSMNVKWVRPPLPLGT